MRLRIMKNLLQCPLQFLLRLWRRPCPLLHRIRLRREMEEEMRFHLEMQIEQNLVSGMSAEEARYAARRQFGNETWLKEASREMWSLNSIETLIQDLRYGARTLMKSPGFAFVAALSLALGIGANLTIFIPVDELFVRPLPAREPDRLVTGAAIRNGTGHAYPAYAYFRDHSKSFEALAAHFSVAPLDVIIDGGSQVARGAVVSANYFPMLGINPRLGRFFLPEEDAAPDRDPVVVISHALWQGRFDGDPSVLGREIRINGVAFKIIGVTPEEFQGVMAGKPNNMWIPTMMLHVALGGC